MRTLPAPLRRLLWLSGVLYVLYLLAGNSFINSPLARTAVNRNPRVFHAQWDWAWTLWPGQIGVQQLQLRGQARKLLWSARGDSAQGRVMLWPLFRRELRFGVVRATTVKLDVQMAAADLKPPAFRPDAWRVTVDHLTTFSLRQLRVGELVADSDGRAASWIGFTHQLRGGASEVFPSRLEMPAARVRYAGQELLHDAHVELRIAMDSFTYEQPAGWRKIERTDLRVIMAGTTPTIALGASRAGALAVSSAPLGGHLSADFSLHHGVLAPGGTLQWNAPVAITDADGSQQRRRGQLDLAVQPDGVMMHARIRPLDGSRGAKTAHRLEADLRVATRRWLPDQSAGQLLHLLSGTADWRWHFASLRWLTPLTSSRPWLQLDGAGDIDGQLHVDAGTLLPGSHVEVPTVDLAAGVLDNVFAGNAHAQARVVAAAVGANTLVGLTVDRFTLAPRSAPGQAYLRGQALQVDMRTSATLAELGRDFLARLHFADAEVPDLRAYNRYLPGKSLSFLGGHGRMSTDFRIDENGDVSAGRMQMSSPDARLALGVSRLSGDLKMDTRLDRASRSGHAFDLKDFTLGLDGVRVEGSRAPPWWARITLQDARLDWDQPMRMQGAATIEMKDVSLLLSLFADRSAFPKWIANVINDGNATAHVRIEAQRGDFILDHLVASNRRVDLFAHLRIRDGKPSGDLYARWGVLGLAVALTDGQRKFHLLHAGRWYRAQPDLLPAEAGSSPQRATPH
ncbi:hypothetical protein ACFPPA_01300 [Rhodanobacter ginsengisoli]|uniref:DUF3971 domain-containing protein n=1 Tax=Rhodanobacter ginsengisoli TaxID=418646 RepID=A0ABW0QHV3_9GAMM